MNNLTLTKSDILNRIPEQYRHFIGLNADTFSNGAIQPMFNFIEAFNLFASFAKINKKVEMFFFSTTPGEIISNAFKIAFTPLNQAIHITQGDNIYFNLHLSSQYRNELQIAMYLEEFAHAYMNIYDEILVKKWLRLSTTKCNTMRKQIVINCRRSNLI